MIDSEDFAEIKECMYDAVANKIIRRINEAHIEWDISFLTDRGVDPSHSEIDRIDEASNIENTEVGPVDGGKDGADSELEGTQGQCDDLSKLKSVIDDLGLRFNLQKNSSYS